MSYLLQTAAKTRSKARRLLLYKVAELVEPDNELALLELVTVGGYEGSGVAREIQLQ